MQLICNTDIFSYHKTVPGPRIESKQHMQISATLSEIKLNLINSCWQCTIFAEGKGWHHGIENCIDTN